MALIFTNTKPKMSRYLLIDVLVTYGAVTYLFNSEKYIDLRDNASVKSETLVQQLFNSNQDQPHT